MKSQTVLMIVIALLFMGCGKSNESEYAVSRLADMMTVYWVLPANTEVTNFELKDSALNLEIETIKRGGKQTFSIPISENREMLEIVGMSKLDNLAIFHILAHPVMESNPEMPFKTHIMWKWIDGKWTEAPQIVPFRCDYTSSRPDRYLFNIGDKPGNFTAAETFRSGNRITAYWHSHGKPIKWFNQAKPESGYISGGIGERGIGLPDNWIERMSISDMKLHENITCIGVGITPEIFVAYFRVFPN